MELMKWAPDGGHDDVVYVYLLTNDINGKRYVGTAWNPITRWNQHFEKDSGIGRALRKYRPENFTKEILAVSNRKGALELEGHYCKLYDCMAPNGYNHRAGGYGCSMSEITRSKISITKKSRPAYNKGKPISQEHKDKIASANKGRKYTTEQRAARSVALKGRKLSQEHKDNIISAKKRKIKNTLLESLDGLF